MLAFYGVCIHYVVSELFFLSSLLSVEKLLSLGDDCWNTFLDQLCSFFDEQHSSTSVAFSPVTVTAASSFTATRSKLNLLCYLCCVVGHKDISNRLMNSNLVCDMYTSELCNSSCYSDTEIKMTNVLFFFLPLASSIDTAVTTGP